MHEAALTLAYLGAALGIAMVVPQIVRIVRNPRMSGVSPTAWALLGLGCLMWMTYGARVGVLPQIPGNIILISGAVIVVMLVPSDRSRAYRLVPLAAAAITLFAVAMLIPAQDVGYLGFSIGLVSSWPQVYDSIQTWRAGSASAVSVSSWLLRAASQVAWLGYAIGTGDRPVVIGASLGLFTATSLIGLEWRSRVNATATPTATAAPPASVPHAAVRPQARAGIAAFGATSRKCAPVASVTAAIRP